ncbi:hypothetical protein SAMN02745146_2879 [Hymenobacter daecheongensis DSM 21074]|uniref:Outer membrane protein beta-barrel family protein n=1 Tax=Hymenobacter daecheongensis DSM 21074 TaxID=1121955 RepID=A0A1M6IL08_9BACT|nr:hypothetical protein [Hymenobacter daecheongensis]SHJ35084.1 hypothetical protein SAMN02745146_2879 [Hymenobacter daecheongensis DSM 21074]
MCRRGAWFLFVFIVSLVLAAGCAVPIRAQQPGQVPAPDSLVLLSFRARRVGVSTYAQQTNLLGSYRLTARQHLRYRLLSEWLYDERGRPPFVREDYLAHALHTLRLGRGWEAGQQLHFEQSRANATRSGAWLGRLGYHHRLRPLAATDTLSEARYVLFGGLGYDARNGRRDAGPAYGLEVTTLVYPHQGSTQPVAVRLYGTRSNLGPRIWQRTVAEGFYERTFDDYSTGALRLGYRSNRAEDYVPGNVQRIQSDTVATQLTWVYRLADRVSFRSDNSLVLPSRAFLYRRLASEADTVQNLRYQQQELDTRQEVRLGSRKLQFMLTFNYRERNRAYSLDNNRNLLPTRLETAMARERVKDITEKTTLWQSELTWLPQPRHALTLLGTAQLLRVDTPSKENEQDRDESQHLLRLTWAGRWAGAFRTTLAVGGEYRQFIFIKAAQSAENYTDRLLHWEPGFTWAPGRFSLKSTYHLWVSYQVRDRASEQLKNRANRVLEQQQNLSYQLTPQRLLTLDYVRRENRVGLLNWPRFRESPLDTTITHDLAGGLRQGWSGPRGRSSLRVGYRFLEQRTHGRAALLATAGGTPILIYLRHVTRQQGPDLAYERHTAAGFTLTTSLWLQQLSTFYRYREGPGLYAGTSYAPEELARATRNLYPYFEIAINWRVGSWR